MKTLLIDNYDSFTYNLFQLLGEVNGVEPVVVRNDAASWAELAALGCDNVVISPGPGRPDRVRDFGVCAEAIASSEVPLLGVCLGHQGLIWAHGGRIGRAPEVVHGRASTVRHGGDPLFGGLPREFEAVRYHSLCAAGELPSPLAATAWAGDGVVMGVAHRTRPQWGVQFHPESICTEHGRRLLANFRDLTAGRAVQPSGDGRRPVGASHPARVGSGRDAAVLSPTSGRATGWAGDGQGAAATSPEASGDGLTGARGELRLLAERLDGPHDPERVFTTLYGGSENAFWLDGGRGDERSRFSFVGDDGGPLAAVVSYDVAAREVSVTRAGRTERHSETIFEYLERETRALGELASDLPFDFGCGFAGYLGYELKADCGGERAHESPLPDAAFVFADRLIAFDHEMGHTYLVALADPAVAVAAERWLGETRARLERLPATVAVPAAGGSPSVVARQSRDEYLEAIARCKELLAEGESYEVCLTNRFTAELDVEPLALYRELRRVNPAPFAAFLRFGGTAVLSSSPERFLRVDRDRWVDAEPIKGTAARGATAAEDARLAARLGASSKDRAENLMIADLLRNDLGSVCEVGSVDVPRLMAVESYETVHQLVSTVRGRLRDGVSAAACVRACFPPGSMTGAPKRRTMEILDDLEGEARGVYSGAIGYFGPGGGCELSVAIRTIVVGSGVATVGAGGAIVMQSDPEDEHGEMLLKARAALRAIDPAADASPAISPRSRSRRPHRRSKSAMIPARI